MEDQGPCTHFLGMKVTWDQSACTVSLSQEKYTKALLPEFDMEKACPTLTPIIPGTHLVPATKDKIYEFNKIGEIYRREIGLLNYLVVCTRPDLALIASQLAQFLNNPGILHWAAFKRVLRYLNNPWVVELRLGGSSIALNTYSDSDYARCPTTRQLFTGYCFLIMGGCVSWCSRKQVTVLTLSTEADNHPAYEAAQEAVWLQILLGKLGYPQDNATTLFCDNQGALKLSKNPLYQSRSKHFDVTYHWIREKVEDGTVCQIYLPTDKMPADYLTKAVPASKFQVLHSKPRAGHQRGRVLK